MPDVFTEVKTNSYGSRIMNAIKGIILGFILFLGSFVLLYWNEGRIDFSKVANLSVAISAETEEPAVQEGQFVSLSGPIKTTDTIGDDYLKPGSYITLERSVEMFAWKENKETTTEKNVGGSETETTKYTYEKKWTSTPEKSESFRYSQDHQNSFTNWVEPKKLSVDKASIGIYSLDGKTVSFPEGEPLALTQEKAIQINDFKLVEGAYLYKGAGNSAAPQIGDVRISYKVMNPENFVTLFGSLNKGAKLISPYFYKQNKFYRVLLGNRDEAINTLAVEHKTITWILRLVGFLCMWIGLMMILKPLSIFLDILPILGSITGAAIGMVTFLVSLLMTTLTIIISMIFHSLIAIAIMAAVVIIGTVMMIKKKTSKGTPAPSV